MFGSHLSIAGSLVNALDEARKLKLDTVQIFTKNQQQWKAKPLDPAVVRDWRAEVARLGWQDRTVSHASYLINLGSPDDELWRKSINLMRDEIERCEALGIPFLVHHPGAFTTSTREAGIARVAAAYGELFRQTKGAKTVSCLENTVGGGSTLGREFTELAQLRDLIIGATGSPERLGICFDTCHAHAGGYDLSTRLGAESALRAFDREVGLSWIRVLHLNDSKAPKASKLNYSGFADRPKIMETPKGTNDAGTAYDTLNLRRLRSLLARSTTGKKPRTPRGKALASG